MTRRPSFYHVAPRYTPGSPALVDEATAEHVAYEERGAIDFWLEGRYGSELKARAERLGLRGIAEGRVEGRQGKHTGWYVRDLTTGEHCFRFDQTTLRKLGYVPYVDLPPWACTYLDQNPPAVPKPLDSWYKVGRTVEVYIPVYEKAQAED